MKISGTHKTGTFRIEETTHGYMMFLTEEESENRLWKFEMRGTLEDILQYLIGNFWNVQVQYIDQKVANEVTNFLLGC